MKFLMVAMAAVFALFGPAIAQDLNGSTLGRSQPGVNAGVPYPNTTATDDAAPAATERTAPVESSAAKPMVPATPKPRKHSSGNSGKNSDQNPAMKTTSGATKNSVTPTN